MKTKAAILTTDGQPIEVGMKLYAVDDCAKHSAVQSLTAIEVDLGRSRSVRLRRANKREWTWSAVDRQSTCRSQNHFLYADKAAASEAVRRIKHERVIDELSKEVSSCQTLQQRAVEYVKRAESSLRGARRERDSAARNLKKAKAALAKAKKGAA